MMMNHGALPAGVGSLSSSSPSSSRRATRVVNLRDIHRLIEECHESLQNNPTCLHTRAIRGHACMKAKMWSLAIQDFTAILQQRPEDIHCRFSRGMALFKSKRIEEAQTDFSTVLAINPHHVMARYARAGCFNTEGEFHRAIQDYTIALQDDEQKTEAGCFRTSSSSRDRLLHQQTDQRNQAEIHVTRVRERSTIDLSTSVSIRDHPVRPSASRASSLAPAPPAGLAISEITVSPSPATSRAQDQSSVAIPRYARAAIKPVRRVAQVTVNLTDLAPVSSPVSTLQPDSVKAEATPVPMPCPVTAVKHPEPTNALTHMQTQQQANRPTTVTAASRMVRKVTVAL